MDLNNIKKQWFLCWISQYNNKRSQAGFKYSWNFGWWIQLASINLEGKNVWALPEQLELCFPSQKQNAWASQKNKTRSSRKRKLKQKKSLTGLQKNKPVGTINSSQWNIYLITVHCYKHSLGSWKNRSNFVQYVPPSLGEGHHVVRVQNFNPVAIRILYKCKSFHFT